MTQPTSARIPVELYSRMARVLHWTTVALLVVQFPVGLYMVYRGNTLNLWDNLTNVLYSAHKLSGVTILVIVLWRITYRLSRGAPADEPTIEPWQRIVSRLNHWGLYVLLIAAPIAGDVHRVLVMLLALLIAMHVGAALYHYLIRKDNVLGRMIPRLLRQHGVPSSTGPRSKHP